MTGIDFFFYVAGCILILWAFGLVDIDFMYKEYFVKLEEDE